MGGRNEKDVFEAVGMAWVPPELREDRGEIEAAQKNQLPRLIELEDLRGDLHLHSKWTDGKHTIEEMALACRERGYRYCAVTDHTQSTRVAGGLSGEEFRQQWEEIDDVREKLDGLVLLRGAEVDILPDGSLDLPGDILDELDVVVASVHERLDMSKKRMTKRVLEAMSHPAVDIIGHPTGRRLNQRSPVQIDLEEIFQAAREYDVALEVDSQPERLDLNDVHLHRARELGVKIAIDSDAHQTDHLAFIRYGVDEARRGWVEKKHVVNTMTGKQLQKWLKRRR